MRHSAESNLKFEYLREYEFISKTALAHESGDPGVLFAEKPNVENLVRLSLSGKQNYFLALGYCPALISHDYDELPVISKNILVTISRD
jgi:hypothetical protein